MELDGELLVADPAAATLDDFNAGASQLLTARTGWSTTAKLSSGDLSWITDATPTYAGNSNTPATQHSNLWATQFAANQEVGFVYATSGIDDTWIYARAAALSSSGTTAYAFQVRWNGVGNQLINPAGSTIATWTQAAPVAGNSYCLQCIGTTINAWTKVGAGAWVLSQQVTDSSVNAAGYAGWLTPVSAISRMDSVFAGSVNTNIIGLLIRGD